MKKINYPNDGDPAITPKARMARPGLTLMTHFKCLLATLTISLAFSGCTSTKKPSCREQFENTFEVNVQGCMKATPDLDPSIARQRCECMLNKLYSVDSTYVFKEGKELDDFVRSNMQYINQCDSIN